MHTTSNNFSALYVLKKHRQHINNTMTPPTLLFLASPILGQVATLR